MITAKEKLIVALDIEKKEDVLKMIDVLSPAVDIFKVGIAPFTDYGETVLEKLAAKGKKVFLDLKFHDIPNTVKNAARAAAKKGVFMMNFHCLGGSRMLKAAVEGAREGSAKAGVKTPLLLGVTVLTSMGPEDLREIGVTEEVEKKVTMFAAMAKAAGLDGVVASAKEACVIKKITGKDFLVVTPGIRPEWAEDGDQKRVLSPREAVKGGADYIVVGRPIIEAKDPLLAANKIIEELKTI